MVPVVTTDNPEDPEDLSDNKGEIEEDTGSIQKPIEEPEKSLAARV